MFRQVIGHIVWIVLVGLILGWMARSRLTPSLEQPTGSLRFPRSFLIVGWAVFGLFVAAAILSAIFPGDADPAMTSLIFLGFSLLGIPVIASYHRVWFRLEESGMSYGRWFGGPLALRWSQVTEVRYSEPLKEFRLKTDTGAVVRVGVMLSGLPEFATTVLREVQESCMDQATRRVLGQIGQGRLPSLWL